MEFHKTLKPFIDKISKLQFSTGHDMKVSPNFDDESTLDVVTRTTCNGDFVEEFKHRIETTVNDIVKESKELLSTLGTYYQREILEIVIHVDRIKYHYFNQQHYNGIEETVLGFDLFNNEVYQIGIVDYGVIETRIEPKEEFYQIVLNQLERLKTELSELLFDEKQEVKPITKLQWNVKPAVLAGLVQELDKKGWITPPLKASDVNNNALANILDSIFEYEGERVSLYNSLKDEKILSEAKRKEIVLPRADSLN